MLKKSHQPKPILIDARWNGAHGIGRFSSEIIARLNNCTILEQTLAPLSIKNIIWQMHLLSRHSPYQLYFTPGFNAPIYARIPYIFCLHDLTHLTMPGFKKYLYQLYYLSILKRAAINARAIITVSNYSKQSILNWVNIAPEKIHVISNGINEQFTVHGECLKPGYPYLLHVGNHKAHKNINRLITAFAQANIDNNIRLIFTTPPSKAISQLIAQYHLKDRIIFADNLSDHTLARFYRGAQALVFPSLSEGFGLPIIEAMACGTPVLTSNITAMPEVAGHGALLVNPYETDAISHGIETIIQDSTLRQCLISNGLKQSLNYNWDKSAQQIADLLKQCII
jgi:glycosyltransferase involved in cell wall biosynthesis